MNFSQLPSNRKFGLFFAAIFGTMALYHFYAGSSERLLALWAACSVLFALIAFFLPQALSPLNKMWFRLGNFMSLIVNPLVLGAIFFFLLTPYSIIGRLMGRDELRLKKKPVNSYWVIRIPNGPASDSFKNQF